MTSVSEHINKAKNRFDELIKLQPQSEIMHVMYAEFLDLRVSPYDAINLLKKLYKKVSPKPQKLTIILEKLYAYVDDIENAVIHRSKAAELYELRGQQIYSNSINEWLEEYEKKSKTIEEKDEIEIIEEEVVIQAQKPNLKYQDPNLIDPWPIESGEYAYTGSGFITSNVKR